MLIQFRWSDAAGPGLYPINKCLTGVSSLPGHSSVVMQCVFQAFFAFTGEKIYMNELLAALIAGAMAASGFVVAAKSSQSQKPAQSRGNRPGRIDDIPRNLASRPQSLI